MFFLGWGRNKKTDVLQEAPNRSGAIFFGSRFCSRELKFRSTHTGVKFKHRVLNTTMNGHVRSFFYSRRKPPAEEGSKLATCAAWFAPENWPNLYPQKGKPGAIVVIVNDSIVFQAIPFFWGEISPPFFQPRRGHPWRPWLLTKLPMVMWRISR